MSTLDAARRLAASALALSLALSGCGTATPTPSPASPTPASPAPASARPPATGTPTSSSPDYAEIRAAVIAIRGLAPTAAVDPVTIDAAQLLTNLEAEFDRSQTPEQLRDTEDLLVTLGLLPAGASLRAITLDFQGGQVAGYYSPAEDELFVVSRSGALSPVDEVTYAHEFTHQLQDQHVDLEALGIDLADQSDRSLARLALVEGDATSVQTTWMQTALTPAELGQVLAAGLDPVALDAFNRAPAYLRETSLFPYQDGLAFVSRLLARGGYAAVDAAFADPPDSTEQVLHPDKYFDREPPITVALPDDLVQALGAGWIEAAQDTLGELLLRIWLREAGVPAAEARVAATGWGGDRLSLVRGPGGVTSVYLRSAWDSAADADEFAGAARLAATQLPQPAFVVHAPGTLVVDVAIGREWEAVLAGG